MKEVWVKRTSTSVPTEAGADKPNLDGEHLISCGLVSGLSLQEEYRAEGITWHNIDYIDNSGCLNLISKKPTALFHLLDEECKYATYRRLSAPETPRLVFMVTRWPLNQPSSFILRDLAALLHPLELKIKHVFHKNTVFFHEKLGVPPL